VLEAREEGLEQVGGGGEVVGEDVEVRDGEEEADVCGALFEQGDDFLEGGFAGFSVAGVGGGVEDGGHVDCGGEGGRWGG